MPNIKLVTSKFSPYGHKVEMVLMEKNISYEKQEVDLSNRPQWFVEESPLGKVPLLYVGDKILFESSVICEYLEESFPQNSLHSKDPIVKAQHRAWMEFSNGILSTSFGLMFAQDAETMNAKKAEIISKIAILEKALASHSYFGGEVVALVDIAMASTFKPLVFIDDKFSLGFFSTHENIAKYAARLIELPSLQKALPANYEEIFEAFLVRKKSYLLTISSAV